MTGLPPLPKHWRWAGCVHRADCPYGRVIRRYSAPPPMFATLRPCLCSRFRLWLSMSEPAFVLKPLAFIEGIAVRHKKPM